MPDKLRCGDCRFWGDAPERLDVKFDNDDPLYKLCGAVKHMDSDDRRLGLFNDLAGACDGSNYAAALVCREDFGCVLFEGKSNESEPIQGIEAESPFWAPWHKTNG